MQLHEEMLEIRKQALRPEHPDTLHSMNNLALSYSSLGWTKEAGQLHEEMLEFRMRALRPEHPNTLLLLLWSMNGPAALYWSLGQTKEAAQTKRKIETRKSGSITGNADIYPL